MFNSFHNMINPQLTDLDLYIQLTKNNNINIINITLQSITAKKKNIHERNVAFAYNRI